MGSVMDMSIDWEVRSHDTYCEDCGKTLSKLLIKDYVKPLKPSDGMQFLNDMSLEIEGMHSIVCPEGFLKAKLEFFDKEARAMGR